MKRKNDTLAHDNHPNHYRLSPSSSDRWLNCPGSARHDLPEHTNPAAEAGTIAHKEAQRYLTDPSDNRWLAMLGTDVYFGVLPLVGADKADQIAYATEQYVHTAQSLPGEHHTELKIAHPDIADFGGTVDFVALHDGGMTIVDLKTGTWKVPAKRNPQLQCYALLARDHFGHSDDVDAAIVQSRVYAKPQLATFRVDDLDKFQDRVAVASESDDLHVGKWCRFCPLKPACPEHGGDGF